MKRKKKKIIHMAYHYWSSLLQKVEETLRLECSGNEIGGLTIIKAISK